MPEDVDPEADHRPTVVAIGGGHGLATVLRAAAGYASDVTAVVSVADDGGSSGRLRRDLAVPAPGDLRKALAALADPTSPWLAALEHRFGAGDLEGHALGNLLIVGMAETSGGLTPALDEIGRLVGARGRVLPTTEDTVVLKAVVEGDEVAGQVAVASSAGAIRRVSLVPEDADACEEAVDAIARADQVVIAPGSLFTSVVAALVVDGIRTAVRRAPGRVIQVLNLAPQIPETEGLTATDHLNAVVDHGARVDVALYDPAAQLELDAAAVRRLGVVPVAAPVATSGGHVHDVGALTEALRSLV